MALTTAQAITITTQTGTPYQTDEMSGYETHGNDMVGMQVWAQFSDSTIQSAIWEANGWESGKASAAGFSVSISGDTWNSTWSIQNLLAPPVAGGSAPSIVSFWFFGPSGNTVFDRSWGNQAGTPGSASGNDFEFRLLDSWRNGTATYKDIVNLTGSAAVGDLYASLRVDLNGQSFIAPGATARFYQDADNAAANSPIRPVPDAGATFGLLSLGLAGIGVLRRRLA